MSERGFEQNLEHVRESEKILQALIDREIRRGIPCERIVLAGFSQGGAIVLHTGLRYPETLAGIMVLSAPIPYAENLMAEIHPANVAVPIFIAHGTDDRVVPHDLVQQTHRRMEARGLRLERHTYKMGHTLVPDEIRDIVAWLARALAGQGG